MSYVVTHNTGTDTPISGVSSLNLPRAILNFGADWRIQKEVPGEELILVNMNSPVAYQETARFAVERVSDIYKNSGITSNLYSPVRTGHRILFSLREVWTETDTADATWLVALPVYGTKSWTIPDDPGITATDILTFLSRETSLAFESGSTTGDRIVAFMRGALAPTDI